MVRETVKKNVESERKTKVKEGSSYNKSHRNYSVNNHHPIKSKIKRLLQKYNDKIYCCIESYINNQL